MNIVVCMKQTFDTESRVELRNGNIIEEDATFIINPYDEYAIEEAVLLKEQFGGTVTVVSVGPERVEQAIRTAYAMGVDHAIHIVSKDECWDENKVSQQLRDEIVKLPYDLILCGNQSIDQGASQVAVRLASLLDIPYVSSITDLRIEAQRAFCQRDTDGNPEVVEVDLPALFTAQQGLNEPRYPTLIAIKKASKKEIHTVLEPVTYESRVNVESIELPRTDRKLKLLEGQIEDQAKELIQLLKNQHVII